MLASTLFRGVRLLLSVPTCPGPCMSPPGAAALVEAAEHGHHSVPLWVLNYMVSRATRGCPWRWHPPRTYTPLVSFSRTTGRSRSVRHARRYSARLYQAHHRERLAFR